MSVKDLEKVILREAQLYLDLPKLKMADIQEWTTGKCQVMDGEKIFNLPGIGVQIALKEDVLVSEKSRSSQ